MKCIKLSHYNWKIVGFRYPGSGSQAIRQSGSLANRQSGSQVIRQSGMAIQVQFFNLQALLYRFQKKKAVIKANDKNGQESGLKSQAFNLWKYIEGQLNLAVGQSGNLAHWQTAQWKYFIFILFYIMPSMSIADATAHDSCTENCGKESPIISTSNASQEAVLESEKECPTNVQSIRRLMAFSYGSCEVLNSPTWRAKENNGVIVHGYTSQPNCNFRENGGKSCTQIDNYQEVMETHPYNKSEKIEACQNNMQCNINGNKTCPVLFAMAGESYAYKDRNNHNEIDVFKHKTKDNAGNTFLGWNCSEYVTTAMALAGRRLVKKNEGRCGDIPSENIGDSKQGYTAQIYVGLTQYSCSCLSSVDITNPNDTIKPGDLISLDGDHIMIVEAAGQPFFKDAKDDVKECDEENIYIDHLQVRVNHASSTMGGPGSTQFSEHQMFNYQQSLSRSVGGYINSCKESASTEDEKNACWTDEDQEEYTDYFHFFKRLGLEESSRESDNNWHKSDSESGNLWPEGSSYPLWPTTRKYLSAVCKVRWYKQKNESVPSDVASTLDAMGGNLTVIRHKNNDTNCMVPENERPKLKNQDCLGDCVEGEKLCAQYE